MRARSSFDYAIIRVVPRVDREEFVNAGAILHCRTRSFLEARIALDHERLLALAPDVDLGAVQAHLDAIPLVCKGGPEAGAIGSLSLTERFHWLVAPRSTIVQPSPVHSGLCEDPSVALDHLVATMVRLSGAVKPHGT
jgi:hypothetical protein